MRHDIGAPGSSTSPVFFDDFTGAELDRDSWNVAVPGEPVNDELQAYCDSTETVRVAGPQDGIGDSNGALIIQPHYRQGFPAPGGRVFDFVSGRIDTRAKVEFTYGTFSARIMLPSGAGLWPAFWALGGNGAWPATGEIDVMENVGEPDWVSAALHGPGYSGETPFVNRLYFPNGDGAAGWRVYGARWEPDRISFFVDGKLLYHATRPMVEYYGRWAYDNPKYLILNLAIGGTYPFKTNGIAAPYRGLGEEALRAIKQENVRMLVDWVRVEPLQ
jgi:beta-glucanase (GH16 family)